MCVIVLQRTPTGSHGVRPHNQYRVTHLNYTCEKRKGCYVISFAEQNDLRSLIIIIHRLILYVVVARCVLIGITWEVAWGPHENKRGLGTHRGWSVPINGSLWILTYNGSLGHRFNGISAALWSRRPLPAHCALLSRTQPAPPRIQKVYYLAVHCAL